MRRRTFLEDKGVIYVTLYVTLNENVQWINVTVNGVTTTYTSSTTVQVPIGATVSWTATARTGYTLSTSSGNFGQMTEDKAISPTASIITYTLVIEKNFGVKSISVTIGNLSSETFTSSNYIEVDYGTKVTWTAVADGNFVLDATSGTINNMTSSYTISPKSVSYNFVWDGQPTVDLGLPSGNIWQAFNLGATKPEEYGLYYQWGDTKGYSDGCSQKESDGNETKHYFYWPKYKHCNGSDTTLTKYCTDAKYGTVDNKTVLEYEDDAAYAASGGQYRMPTHEEYRELYSNNTICYEITYNGIKGYVLISKKDASKAIFFPLAGYGEMESVGAFNRENCYWSSSLMTSGISFHNRNAYCIWLDDAVSTEWRCVGGTIRGVLR